MTPALMFSCLLAASTPIDERLDEAVRAGRPIVVHVVVGLVDNDSQGISPVPKQIGDGRSPGTNLYWGAAYGLRTFLRREGWKDVPTEGVELPGLLERRAFTRTLSRGGKAAQVVLIAEAWDGTDLPAAMRRFFALSGGAPDEVRVGGAAIPAGGDSALVVWVGHNGLMDFEVAEEVRREASPARAAAVFACFSEQYFSARLVRGGASPVVMTRGLMAPEGYVVDGAVWAFVEGRSAPHGAAEAYARYQKISLGSARRLFGVSAKEPRAEGSRP